MTRNSREPNFSDLNASHSRLKNSSLPTALTTRYFHSIPMGCIGGGIWPGDRCIFQINFSGVIQVLLSSSQALNSANYYQLGILKKQPEKHFTLLQLALAHQPVLCRVKYSCQAVMCFVFFPLPDYSWAEAELITSETVFLGWLQTKNVISQRSAEVSETRFHCNVE